MLCRIMTESLFASQYIFPLNVHTSIMSKKHILLDNVKYFSNVGSNKNS